ncbi:MAG: sigma-70 family RNA polymerase sigma factor [Myxococcota bacterium]|nr:sigma-70 family RNA polymerase sigma factor [Myxococcota bacterium]
MPVDRRRAGYLFGPGDRDQARWVRVGLTDDLDGLPSAAEEERFIGRLIARDERAFNALVRRFERRIFLLVLRMLGSDAEAEELAQEVFVQVFKNIGSFRRESKLSTWIYRIAINLCKNRLKYLRVRRAGEQEPLETVEEQAPLESRSAARIAGPDEVAAGRQVESVVRASILALEPSFRECLVLRDVEDLSYEEIADITGLPEGTVKSRIHRARGQLRLLVEQALGEKIV